MSKATTLRLSNQILDEASGWFVEFASGQPDQAAREEFVRWLRSSPEHVRAYLQISAHWEDSRALEKSHKKTIDELVRIASQAGANVIRLESAAQVAVQSSGILRRGRSRLTVVTSALAATLAMVIVGIGAWYHAQRDVYSTGIGELRSIKLVDGSTVELNALSRIRVRFSERQRDVELLAGQALFKVAKEKARPFVVSSDGTRIRAVGTQFDVYRKRDELIVTVVEGRVSVAARSLGDSDRSLTPGEQLAVTPTRSDKKTAADVAAATAWTQKQIILKNTPLAEVVEEFNRYNRRHLVITDSAIATIRISGIFSSTDPASLLRGLDDLSVFTITETDDHIEISGK